MSFNFIIRLYILRPNLYLLSRMSCRLFLFFAFLGCSREMMVQKIEAFESILWEIIEGPLNYYQFAPTKKLWRSSALHFKKNSSMPSFLLMYLSHAVCPTLLSVRFEFVKRDLKKFTRNFQAVSLNYIEICPTAASIGMEQC